MGFLFGLMIGASVAGGGSSPQITAALASIPFRCIAALEVSEQDYKDCRRVGLVGELYGAPHYVCRDSRKEPGYINGCDLDRQMGHEVRALRAMEAALKAQAAEKR
jgi:hypothetical protein